VQICRAVYTLALALGLLCVPVLVFAQSAPGAQPHVPLQKTIGQARPQVVPSLIVMNARGASLQGGKLTLIGVSPNSIVFADRPVRSAGHALTAHLIGEWATGADSFAKDPPNATVSVFTKDGSGIRDAVVVLKSPKLEGDQLTFDVEVLEGELSGADGAASVFIDIIGLPFTPLSFAGVARRASNRAAWYAGAAAAGAAAGAVLSPYAAYGAYRGAPYYGPDGYVAQPNCPIDAGYGRLDYSQC
jgi:hypothetical protein